MQADRRAISDEAAAFLVWRQCARLDWDATVTEVAELTGLSRNRVRMIAVKRGWPVTDYAEPPPRAVPVDLILEGVS